MIANKLGQLGRYVLPDTCNKYNWTVFGQKDTSQKSLFRSIRGKKTLFYRLKSIDYILFLKHKTVYFNNHPPNDLILNFCRFKSYAAVYKIRFLWIVSNPILKNIIQNFRIINSYLCFGISWCLNNKHSDEAIFREGLRGKWNTARLFLRNQRYNPKKAKIDLCPFSQTHRIIVRYQSMHNRIKRGIRGPLATPHQIRM